MILLSRLQEFKQEHDKFVQAGTALLAPVESKTSRDSDFDAFFRQSSKLRKQIQHIHELCDDYERHHKEIIEEALTAEHRNKLEKRCQEGLAFIRRESQSVSTALNQLAKLLESIAPKREQFGDFRLLQLQVRTTKTAT